MSKTPRMLPVDRWPSVAAFFRGYLHQDAGDEHHSVEAAFTSFWDDANADERLAFAKEWRALRSLVEGRAWHRVEPRLASLGLAWMPAGGSGFARISRHIDGLVRGRR